MGREMREAMERARGTQLLRPHGVSPIVSWSFDHSDEYFCSLGFCWVCLLKVLRHLQSSGQKKLIMSVELLRLSPMLTI